MKKDYKRSIPLRCAICGSTDHFEFNDDKTYVKCTLCNKEYFGGYDELVQMNEAMIAEEVESLKMEVKNDIEKDVQDMFKNAFKGSKSIKIK